MRQPHMRIGLGLLVMFFAIQLFSLGFAAPKNIFSRRYVALDFDMLNRGKVNANLRPIVERAGSVGYNGVLLREWYNDLESNSTKMKTIPVLKDFKAFCEGQGLEVIPYGMYVGENSHKDSSVAEAFSVKGTRFQVSGNSARVASDHTLAIKNGGFESSNGNKPNGWTITGLAHGINLFIDKSVKKSGSASLRVESPEATSRINQPLGGMKPNRAYELSVWIKTEAYQPAGALTFYVVAGGRTLLYRRAAGFGRWGVSPNLGSFRQYTLDFNSLECSSATVMFKFSQGSASGKVWIDDISIREVGLYETIRRESCPVKVCSEDGKVTYKEGKDYTVKPGNVICTGSNDGQALIIPAGSKIQNGDYLRVDWYQHANVESSIASTSFCSDKAWDYTKETVRAIDDLFSKPRGVYVFIDEWREGGWDAACSRFPNAGEYMGWVAAEKARILKKDFLCRELYVTNDMYDPYHNAHNPFFMTRNGTIGSWKSLPNSYIIMNWRSNQKSLNFFGGLDPEYPDVHNRQMLSHVYGAPHAQRWEEYLVEAEKKGLNSVVGIYYETWTYDFRNIEAVAEFYKKTGRWGKGPIPWPKEGDVSCKMPGIESEKGAGGMANVRLAVSLAAGKISYSLPKNCKVDLKVVDALGRVVRRVENRLKTAGTYSLTIESLQLPSGVYFTELKAGEKGALGRHARKIVVL